MRRLAGIVIGLALLAGGVWWGVVGSAKVAPLPPAPPDEGQEPALHQAYLTALVQRRPENWEARAALAAALSEEGRDREAAEQLRQAVRAKPADGGLSAALALSAQKAGWTEEEVRAWRQVARLDPSSVLARTRLSTLYRQLGYTALAIRAAKDALRIAPDDPDALRSEAIVQYQAQDYATAERAARRLVELEPNDSTGFSILSACRAAVARWPGAIEAAEQAVRVDPNSGARRAELAKLYMDRPPQPDFERALAVLGADPLGDPQEELTRRYWRGVCYQKMGKPAEAIQELRMVSDAAPQFEEVAFYLSRAYQQKGDAQQAATYTRIYQQTQSRRLELNNAESALRRNLKDPEAHARVARAALESGDRERALFEAQVALEMRPGKPEYQQLLQSLKGSPEATDGAGS